MSRIALVVAMAENGVIGHRGQIPWRIPDDMKHFKAVTMGKPVVMGRKTWESLPKKPLPGRTNIVVTRAADFKAEGARIARSLDAAIELANEENPSEIAIIGGGEIYAAALPRTDRIYLTEVKGALIGDVRFAMERAQWRETSREDHAGDIPFSFVTLERK